MARFLAVDVGAGTLDAMFLDTRSGDQFKFVAKSPTRTLAEKIMACKEGEILITGHQMGGGPVTEAIRTKARECRVMMTRSAACFPRYEFAKNKGYGTPVHLAALREIGPSPIHRMTFKTVPLA